MRADRCISDEQHAENVRKMWRNLAEIRLAEAVTKRKESLAADAEAAHAVSMVMAREAAPPTPASP